ncbi:MAG: site-2 protease family protein, partial [Candidatus Bathyarchaeia archaeon]
SVKNPNIQGEAYLSEGLLFAILTLAFWLAVYVLGRILPLEKHGLIVKPLFIRYDSEGFKSLLYKCSGKWRALWKVFSHISVLLGLGLMIFALIFLSRNLLELLLVSGREIAVVPIVPGLTLSLYWLPYFLIAVLIAVFTHESAHGILALTEGAGVKSAGALILAVFFGGFVEIDEAEISRLSYTSRMRIFSAGSASNILGGLLVLLLTSALFTQTPSGIVILEVLEGGPLDSVGIGRWTVIYAINGTTINTHQDLSNFMLRVKPGDRLILSTSLGERVVTAAPNPNDANRAIIGIISPSLLYYPSRLGLGFFWDTQLYLVLNWLFLVLVNVAIFNMLPIPLLDGDRFLQCLLNRLSAKGDLIKKFFNILSIFLIAANITLSLRA